MEPDEPVPEERGRTITEANIARVTDVHPWKNELGHTFDHYRYGSYLDIIAARGIEFPTGYEAYQEGLWWHDWNYEDRCQRPP